MIPRLSPKEHLPDTYQAFLDELRGAEFRGDIHTDYATRLVTATDNSVYQIVPLGVVYPRNEADVARVLELMSRPQYRSIKLSPRGGGTGTNGQSLCDGLIMDVSRYMRDILELNLEEGWVRVQPGVVLDQLNAFLSPYDVFFAPHLSPSNRATLGGMISTDACGKGSRVYGKTSEHVLGLRSVLVDGSVLSTEPMTAAQLEEAKAHPGLSGAVYREVDRIVVDNKGRIESELPKMKRFMTGYDLAHVRQEGGFDLSRVLTGSEGTLAILVEAKLQLTRKPRYKQLLAIRYAEFDHALRAAQILVGANPGAIETVDDTIVNLAKKDVIWDSVAHLVEKPGEPPVAAVNLVEFESHDQQIVEQKVASLIAQLDAEKGRDGAAMGHTLALDPGDIAALWNLRKKGVGLLGNAPGARRPVPFVEDTAVPPENLADYIAEFRKLLDRRGLRYGMFGHVDVGCLHVRPALDLKDPEDEVRLRQISDEVVELVKKYGGVLWGEHGRGYRSEYTPTFFGPELYEALRQVKAAFDPHNQLNPGKLATPSRSNDRLVSVDAMKRGAYDRDIDVDSREKFAPALNCNGNGACFDWNPDSVMCPSSKVRGERIHSPKGRAGILREWLRLMNEAGHPAAHLEPSEGTGQGMLRSRSVDPQDFSHQVYDAMNGCLACKACATQCPIKVDIPHMRSHFFDQYHSRYRRPLKDYFVAVLEHVLVFMAVLPAFFNFLSKLPPSRWLLRKVIGIVDAPPLAKSPLGRQLKRRGALCYDKTQIDALDPSARRNLVFVAQDAFTSYYEPNVAIALWELLTAMGKTVVFLPFLPNGKGLHVKGFLGGFRNVARRNLDMLSSVAQWGAPIIGVEPAVTLTYRDEYLHELGQDAQGLSVLMPQEYLADHLTELQACLKPDSFEALQLFGHCTERTFEPASMRKWVEIFDRVGVQVAVQDVGCCGMCGVFGHEEVHLEESRGVFDMSWAKHLPETRRDPMFTLATGHSCRSQVKRFAGFVPAHPTEILASWISS